MAGQALVCYCFSRMVSGKFTFQHINMIGRPWKAMMFDLLAQKASHSIFTIQAVRINADTHTHARTISNMLPRSSEMVTCLRHCIAWQQQWYHIQRYNDNNNFKITFHFYKINTENSDRELNQQWYPTQFMDPMSVSLSVIQIPHVLILPQTSALFTM